MDIQEARGWVAQAWCEPENAGKEMDSELAEAMAKVLVDRIQEDRSVRRFVNARGIMAAAFRADEGLRIAYVANVAMLLRDRYGITDHAKRNEAAVAILDLIFAG